VTWRQTLIVSLYGGFCGLVGRYAGRSDCPEPAYPWPTIVCADDTRGLLWPPEPLYRCTPEGWEETNR